MLDGLWVGEWVSNVLNVQMGSGVLIFRQGKILGGNDRVYFIGDYSSDGNRIEGNLRLSYYAGEPLGIFGLIDVNQSEDMFITGDLSGDILKIEGTMKSNSKLRVNGFLLKKAGGEIF